MDSEGHRLAVRRSVPLVHLSIPTLEEAVHRLIDWGIALTKILKYILLPLGGSVSGLIYFGLFLAMALVSENDGWISRWGAYLILVVPFIFLGFSVYKRNSKWITYIASWVISMSLMVLAFILPLLQFTTVNDTWEANWNLKILKAQSYVTVFDTRGGFHGDGETYTICSFDVSTFEQAKRLDVWNPVDQSSLSKVSSYVSQFEKQVIDIHFDDTTTYSKQFSRYPISFAVGSEYFYRIHSDGSYIIAVLDPQRKRVYVLEWFT
jgi:hypothetical protein